MLICLIITQVQDLIKYQTGLAAANGVQLTSWQALKAGIVSTMKAMATWMVSNPAGWVMIAATAVIGLAGAYDLLTTSAKEANEAMDDAVHEYSDAKDKLQSITKELEEHNTQIEELESKDKLTYAEKGQLEELQAITKELLLQQDIAERRAERASKEAAKKAVDAYNTAYSDYDVSDNAVNTLLSNAGFPTPKDEYDVTGGIASLIRATELLEQSKQEYEEAAKRSGADTSDLEEDIQSYIDDVDAATTLLNNNISDLQDKQLVLEEEYQKAIQKSKNGAYLTSSEKDIIATYNEIDRILRMIYSYTDPSQWNQIQIYDLFDIDSIEKTKDELVAMAKSGELTPEAIKGYTELNQALNDSNLILEDGQTAAQAFCEEIYAIAEASEAAKSVNNDEDTLFLSDKDAQILDEYQSKISSISSSLKELNDLTSSDITSLMTDFKDNEKAMDIFKKFGVNGKAGVGDLKSALEEIGRLLMEAAKDKVPQMTDAIEDMFKVIANPKGDVTKLSAELEELDDVLEKVQNSEVYSEEVITALINKYPDLADAVKEVTGGYSLEEDAVISLLNSKITASNEAVSYELEETKAVVEAIKERIKARLIEQRAYLKTGIRPAYLDENGETVFGGVYSSEDFKADQEELAAAEEALQQLLECLRQPIATGDNDFYESIDWAAQSIEVLEDKVSDLETILDNTKGWDAQKKAIDQVIAAQSKLKAGYEQSAQGYKEKYLNVLSTNNLSDEIRSAIESGEKFSIEDFIDKNVKSGDKGTREKLYEAIQEAIDWYNKYSEANDNAIRIGFEIDANELEKLNKTLEEESAEESLAKVKLDASVELNKDDFYADLAKEAAERYDAEIAIAEAEKNQLKVQELQIQKAKELRDIEAERLAEKTAQSSAKVSLTESKLSRSDYNDATKNALYSQLVSEVNDDYQNQINEAMHGNDFVKAEELRVQWAQKLLDIEQERIELVRAQDEALRDELDLQYSILEAEVESNENGIGTYEQYVKMIENREDAQKSLTKEIDREKKKLTEIEKENGKNSEEYRTQFDIVANLINQLLGVRSALQGIRSDLGNLVQNDIDEAMGNLDEEIEDVNDQIESVNKQLEKMDAIIAGAQAYIQDQIDAQEELKKPIEEQLEALQKANDERERALALDKARYELERARSQRTVKMYAGEDKGFIYTQNQDDIRNAQENLDKLEYEEVVNQLEKQLEYYDKIIEGLQEIKDAWGSVAQNAQDALDIQKALAALGTDGIMSIDVAKSYEQQYQSLLSNKESLNGQLGSLEDRQDELDEFMKKYNKIIEEWNKGANALDTDGKFRDLFDEYETVLEREFPDKPFTTLTQGWLDATKEAEDMNLLWEDLVGRISGSMDSFIHLGDRDVEKAVDNVIDVMDTFFEQANGWKEEEFDFNSLFPDTSRLDDLLTKMSDIGYDTELWFDPEFNDESMDDFVESLFGANEQTQYLMDLLAEARLSAAKHTGDMSQSMYGFGVGVSELAETAEQAGEGLNKFGEDAANVGDNVSGAMDGASGAIDATALSTMSLDEKVNYLVTTVSGLASSNGFSEFAGAASGAMATVSGSIDEVIGKINELSGAISGVISSLSSIGSTAQAQISVANDALSQVQSIAGSMSSAVMEATSGLIRDAQNAAEEAAKTISDTLSNAMSEKSEKESSKEIGQEIGKAVKESLSGKGTTGGSKYDKVALTYHDGIENGLVGQKNAGNGIKDVALRKLDPDEIPAILQVNEAVLTQLQQGNVLHNMGAAYKSGMNSMANVATSNRNAQVNIGDVNISCPGVTSQQVMKQIGDELHKQFGNFALDALQISNKR